MARVEPQKNGAGAGPTAKTLTTDVKGKTVEFSFWMLKEGYAEDTIKERSKLLKILVKRGADLYDPESVKRTIATQRSWCDGRKKNAVDAYSCFLKMLGRSWEPPTYRGSTKMPFIPLETEVDQLIAGCGKKMAAFLQGLKETGADPGELWRAEWTDVDVEKRVVRINHPVKGHNPRILQISPKWISMLERLPKKSERIFGGGVHGSFACNFRKQRRSLAVKLNNPRLMEISFTTFRHWVGTMQYHMTNDAYHVKKILGHKHLSSTEIYINLEQALFQAANDEFHVKVAEDVKETCSLIEAGFDYVGKIHGVEVFRKRK